MEASAGFPWYTCLAPAIMEAESDESPPKADTLLIHQGFINRGTQPADASGVLGISRQSGNMSQMLGMLEMQGMQPHNVQEQTQSSHPTFQDFQTHTIDQSQKMPEMSGMLGMQPAGHKKVQKQHFFVFFEMYQNQPSKTELAIPLKYPKHRLPKTR